MLLQQRCAEAECEGQSQRNAASGPRYVLRGRTKGAAAPSSLGLYMLYL